MSEQSTPSSWQSPELWTRPVIIAHRGACAHAPENTLVSAKLAHARHADAWELDVALTADGHPVLLHDDDVSRTTDAKWHRELAELAPWRVWDLTLEQIRKLDAGEWFCQKDPLGVIAAGKMSTEEAKAYAGEPIPTLEEALRLTAELDWLVNIEIKDHASRPGHEIIAGRVVSAVRNMRMEGRVLISSFQPEYLKQIREFAPEIALGLLMENMPRQSPAELCQACGAGFYLPRSFLARPEMVPPLHDAGIKVMPWTINKPWQLDNMMAAGVDGFFTDFLQTVREHLGIADD